MKQFEVLDFDSQLFDFKVARILPSKLNLLELSQLLNELEVLNVTLVYWSSASADTVSQEAARSMHGFLADRKVTYVLNLTHYEKKELQASRKRLEVYAELFPNEELKALALQIGLQSRFGMDPKLRYRYMEKMYYAWIANSVNGTNAHHVLVYKENHRIIGMITLGVKKGRGDIGLVSVDVSGQRKGIGAILVQGALAQFIAEGYKVSQVVTQQHNMAACRLYEKLGYHVEEIEHVYHFWLK